MSILTRLRKAFSRQPFFSASTRGGSGSNTITPTFSQAAGIKAFNSWVYAAANLNAIACASTPLRLYARNNASVRKLWNTRTPARDTQRYLLGDAKSQPSPSVLRKVAEFGDDFAEVNDDHPLLRLFSRSNPFLNGFDATVLRILHGELTGNAYLHPVLDANLGIPTEIWLMPPQWVEIIPDPTTFIKAYKYGAPGAKAVEFKPDEVIHFKRPHPSNLYYGMGKVEAAWGVVCANQAVHEMDHAMYKNRARPDYVASVKGNPSDEELDRLEAAIKETLRGNDKNGKFILTSADLTLQAMNFPPKDLTGRDEIVEEIAAVFGVPVSMLKANDPNLASATTGFNQWREGTIAPLLRMDEETLNQTLLPMFGLEGQAVLAYDDPVRANEQLALTARQVAVAGGWKTPNEARAEEGVAPHDNEAANELYLGGVALGSQPVGAPVPMPFALETAKVEPPSAIVPQVIEREITAPTEPPVAKCCDHAKRKHSHREMWSKAVRDPIKESKLEPFVRSLDEALSERVREVVRIINKEPKPTKATLARVQALLSKTNWSPQLAEAMRPYITDALLAGVDAGSKKIEAQIRAKMPVGIGLSGEKLDRYIDTASTRLVTHANEGIRQVFSADIRDLLSEGVDLGEDNQTLANRVQEWASGDPDDERNIQWRALRVARTEVMRAHESAQLDAWNETGLVEGKRWILSPDACEFCKAAADAFGDGSHPIDKPFFAKGESLEGADGGTISLDYGDVDAPPLHPNCRCDMIPVMVGDYQPILEEMLAEVRAQHPGGFDQ